MDNCGEFAEYERYNAEMEAHLAQALVDVEKKADAWATEYAAAKYAEHCKRPIAIIKKLC